MTQIRPRLRYDDYQNRELIVKQLRAEGVPQAKIEEFLASVDRHRRSGRTWRGHSLNQAAEECGFEIHWTN